jgi:NO-binding membrane sensor protein with MHYT domain/CheY-like chemotaxis protein/two-component sensor histidine kinase
VLVGYFQTSLVVVSILVAILASYTALSLAGRVSTSHDDQSAHWWLAGGAFAMGTGIWSMHFIGMLAFRLPISLGYDFWITLLSFLIAVAASGFALWQVSQPELPVNRLVKGALLMGIGINAMHYTGMAAMRMQPDIQYDPLLFAASVAIAITAAGAALWIAFRLRMNTPHVWLSRSGAAIVMGSAIVGMHYTGMAAANFPLDSICMAANQGVSPNGLAIVIAVSTFAILTIALLVSVYDARLESHTQTLALSQAIAEERRNLLTRERSARVEVERLSEVKDQFLSTLSHELRTPLSAILGWTDLLLRGVKNEDQLRAGLEAIDRNAQVQARLIDELLDMSRIVSGKLLLDLQLVSPASFIDAAIETIRPQAMVKSIQIERRLEPNVAPILGDASRLQQVMWNLLSNAVKFTPDGGKVQVLSRQKGQHVEICVIDNGIGIKPEFIPYVFDRFQQADASTTRKYGGLGLGLSITRQLLELQGGTVQAISAGEGKGASFRVLLPLPGMPSRAFDESLRDAGSVTTAPGNYGSVDLTGIKILVVDDQADGRDLIEHYFVRCGATVLAAASAEEALLLFQKERPNILVTDIGMPEMDGFELLRRVRALGPLEGGNIPAIAVTAFARQEDREKAMNTGFTACLSKPVDHSELLSSVARVSG